MAHVLYLGNDHQILYRTGPRRCREVWRGRKPPDSRPGAWCGVRRLRLLVDLIEEEFRLERLPHLFGPDHRALVERKRRQLFRDAELVAASRIGRERHGRRDDLILFTALRASVVLEGWRTALAAWEVRIRGAWSLPQLSEAGLLPRWRDGLRVVVYTSGDRLALRQNYRRGGRLTFSRQTLVSADALADEAAEEIERTWRYLQRTLELPADQERPVQIVAPAESIRSLVSVVGELPGLRVESHTLCDGDLPSRAASHLNCRPWRRPHYRLAGGKRDWATAGPYLAGLGALLAAGSYGVYAWDAGRRLEQSTLRLQRERQALQRRLAETPQPPAIDGFSPWQIAALLDGWRRLRPHLLDPMALLKPVSRVLDRFPDWELTALDWTRPDDPEGDTAAPPTAPPILTLTLRTAAPDDPRRLVQRLQALREALARQPAIDRVEIVASPLPLRDDQALSGALGTQTPVPISTTFRLKLWFHPAANSDDG